MLNELIDINLKKKKKSMIICSLSDLVCTCNAQVSNHSPHLQGIAGVMTFQIRVPCFELADQQSVVRSAQQSGFHLQWADSFMTGPVLYQSNLL